MVQTRSQEKAQINATTVQSTKPVTQKTVPKIAKIPIQTEKEKDSRSPPSRVDQQPPKGLVIFLGTIIPLFGMHSNVRPPPKPPNVDKVQT